MEDRGGHLHCQISLIASSVADEEQRHSSPSPPPEKDVPSPQRLHAADFHGIIL